MDADFSLRLVREETDVLLFVGGGGLFVVDIHFILASIARMVLS